MQAPFTDSGSGTGRIATLHRLAEQAVEHLVNDPRVEAAIIVGSAAHGIVDEVSDVDIMIYINEYFTEEEIQDYQEQAKASGGGIYGANPEHGFGVWPCMNGVKIDLAFNMIPNMEELIDEVLKNHSLENDFHLIVRGIRNSHVIHGREFIETWLNRMNDFPEALAEKMVKENLRVSPLWIARDMCAGRNERVWFPELALEYLKRNLWVLCGLNRQFYPGKVKGFRHVAEGFAIAPKNYAERTESVFGTEPAIATEILRDLVLDVYDLVDTHMPAIETAQARSWFLTDVVCR